MACNKSRRNDSPLPRLQLPIFPVIPHDGHASALSMRLQALQGFNERQLPLPPCSSDVGDPTKHRDIAVARHDFPLYLTPCEALQAIKEFLGSQSIMLAEPCDGGLATQGSVPADVVSAVADVRG